MSPQILEDLLYRAVNEPLGLEIKTNNVNALLTQIRTQYPGIGQALGVVICKPALPNTIFILKKSVELSP